MRDLAAQTRLERLSILYPSGNTTAVIFDEPPDCARKNLNTLIMNAWKHEYPTLPEIEQCCFVASPRDAAALARVEMFGGEFCGNATRSVAWLLSDGKDYTGCIEVSGVDRPLECVIQDGMVSLEMPLPQSNVLCTSVAEGMLVRLDGISQLVVVERAQRQRQTPRDLLTHLLRENVYGLAAQLAVGVSYYDEGSAEAKFCVWVKEVNTVFDETACGSGTSAIGIALAEERRESVAVTVRQPSGEPILSTATYAGFVTGSRIMGAVRVLYDGEFSLS